MIDIDRTLRLLDVEAESNFVQAEAIDAINYLLRENARYKLTQAKYVEVIDRMNGTPCEQIRHQQEVEALREENARLIRENKVAFEAVGGVVKANDKLKEENARLREALKPFADGVDCYTETATEEYPVDYGHFFLGHLRAAAAAIREGGKDD